MEVAPPLERTATHSDRGGDPASSGEGWSHATVEEGCQRRRCTTATHSGGPRRPGRRWPQVAWADGEGGGRRAPLVTASVVGWRAACPGVGWQWPTCGGATGAVA
jgi:hypothetical protein